MHQNESAVVETDVFNTTFINNATLVNNKTLLSFVKEQNPDEPEMRLAYWQVCLLTSEMAISFICNMVTLRVMTKCRKLSFSIRYLSINLLVAFLLGGGSVILHNTARLLRGLDGHHQLIFDSRTFFYYVFLLNLWCSICSVTAERFIALVFPFSFTRFVTKTRLSVIVGLQWSFNIISPSAIVLFSWRKLCNDQNITATCVFRPLRIFTATMLCILGCIIVSLYAKILIELWCDQAKTKPFKRSSANTIGTATRSSIFLPTSIILSIVLSFFVLQSPILINIIIFELRPDLQRHQWRTIFQLIFYISGELNTFVTLYLYIWRFPECRMNLYFMFSKIFGKYRKKAELIRLDVFNIVISDKRSECECISKPCV